MIEKLDSKNSLSNKNLI